MKNRRFGKTALIAAAVTLTASLSVGSALGYFTTYCTAEGAVTMNMGFTNTDIWEEIDEEGKHVKIQNTGDYACFVRVKAFAPDFAELKYTSVSPGDWTEKDGYWEYNTVLEAKAETSELLISYTLPEDMTEFNIIVVYEYSPVFYDENGNPTANWEFAVTESSTEQGGE